MKSKTKLHVKLYLFLIISFETLNSNRLILHNTFKLNFLKIYAYFKKILRFVKSAWIIATLIIYEYSHITERIKQIKYTKKFKI